MARGLRVGIGFLIVSLAVGGGVAAADETDNFTCRSRLTRDSLGALDAMMNAAIRDGLARANRRGASCDARCVVRELEESVGGSVPHPLTGIPHARFESWINADPGIDRCHLRFRESIYGARAYQYPWLFPINGRIIFLADSIALSGRVVGLDKINHFLREGLAHWRATQSGADIAVVLRRELGTPNRGWRLSEYGLKGLSMTGVLAYADLAAGYSGFTFWTDLLELDTARSFIAYDTQTRSYIQRRAFTFAEYVTDAWDEGINYSLFHPVLADQVAAALRRESLMRPVTDCRTLADLPHAELYVNPACLGGRVETAHGFSEANGEQGLVGKHPATAYTCSLLGGRKRAPRASCG